MKTKTFDPFNRPKFFQTVPEPQITKNDEIWSKTLHSNDEIELEDGLVLVIDYISSGEYSEDREVELSLKRRTFVENEHYETQLKAYNSERSKYDKAVKEWDDEKLLYDTNKEKQKEVAERKELARLKKKYEL